MECHLDEDGLLCRCVVYDGYRSGRPASTLRAAAQFCEGMGTGLPATDDQRHSVLDRDPVTQAATAAGRGPADDDDRGLSRVTAWVPHYTTSHHHILDLLMTLRSGSFRRVIFRSHISGSSEILPSDSCWHSHVK